MARRRRRKPPDRSGIDFGGAGSPTAVKRGPGAPRTSPELLARVLERIAAGESLPSICGDPAMPALSTITSMVSGLRPSPPGFVESYREAKRAQAAVWAEELTDIADEDIATPQEVQRNRLRVGVRQWLVSRLLREEYGDRVEVAGDPAAPIQLDVARARLGERLAALAKAVATPAALPAIEAEVIEEPSK